MPIIGRGGVVVHEISAPGYGGGGAAPAEDWVRPTDWLTLPTLVDGDERVVGLYAVYNHDSNFVALMCSGAYTVDWGDGVIENVATNTTAQHRYTKATYTALGAGTDCSRGYRQAIISITPQAGQHLTAVSFNYKHSQAGLQAYYSQWLDIAVAGQSITSILVGYTTGNLSMLEQFRWIGGVNAGLTSLDSMFYTCYSLQSVQLFDTSNVTNMSSMFRSCYSLQSVPLFNTSNATNMSSMFNTCYSLQSVPLIDTSNATNMSSMFSSCYSLQSVPLFDTSNVTSMSNMFYNCYSLQSVPLFDTSSVTNMSSMFYNCRALQSVPLLDTSNATNMSSMFNTCYSLQSVPLIDTSNATNMSSMFNACYSLGDAPLQGTVIDHSFANCKLGKDELVAIFTGLGTVSGKTITITGNWGVASLTSGDRAIATGKGWTIAE